MKKKFFAILVAGAVFFSMLPMVAFGDTGNGSEPPNGTPQTEMGTPNSTDPDNLIDPEEPDGEEDVYADSGDMSKTSAKMKAGEKMQLSVINENPAGSFIDVYWETTNKKVATVDQDGKVTALKAGKCTISATFPNGKVITCKVTVVPHLKYTKVTLWKQSSQTNKLLGATSKVKWKTSSKKIATVSSKGKIKGKKAGKCKVTAIHKGKKYVCTVYVRNPKLRSKKATIHNTAYYQQRVTGGSGKIKWTTSNKKVATVNSKGKITARKAGKCTITAVRNGVKMRCKVTVPSKYQGTKVPDFGAKFGKLRFDTEHWGEDPDVHIYYKKVSKDQVKKYLAAVKKAGLKKQKMSDGRTCYQHANGDGIIYSLKKGKLHINLYNIHDSENSGADEE